MGSSEESLHVEGIWLMMDLRVCLELGSPPWRPHVLRLWDFGGVFMSCRHNIKRDNAQPPAPSIKTR